MTDYIELKANAKINIALDVIGKREDGYHNLAMVMQTVSLHDNIFIKKTFSREIKIISNLKWLPTDQRNLVYKACDVLFNQYNQDQGVFIEINKNIPICAGLGGGSADCAATLIGIRKLFDLPVSDEELYKIGKSLGADVPYCLMRGTVLAEGIGEILTPLPSHPPVFVLLAKPPVNVQTGSVFNTFDIKNVEKRPNIDQIIEGLKIKNVSMIADEFCNVLESVTEKDNPVITVIKKTMLRNNALGALMSGSGPTVFGYFNKKSDVFNAIGHLRNHLGIKDLYLTKIFNPGRNGINE